MGYYVAGSFKLCVTTDILLEYEEILRNKVNRLTALFSLGVIINSSHTENITPFYKWRLIPADPDDNKFVDCAVAASADYIVTDDHHFDVLRDIPFPHVNVITLDDFGKMLKKEYSELN